MKTIGIYGTADLSSAALDLRTDGTGAADSTYAMGDMDYTFYGVLLHAASLPMSGLTVTVTLKSKIHTNYDVVLKTTTDDLVAQQNWSWFPNHPISIPGGYDIQLALTNTGTPATSVYGTILVRQEGV